MGRDNKDDKIFTTSIVILYINQEEVGVVLPQQLPHPLYTSPSSMGWTYLLPTVYGGIQVQIHGWQKDVG